MAVLTGWSLANLGPAYWNTVNLALGVAGLVGTHREDRALARPAAVTRAHRHRSLFTWDAALDVLYVTTGAVLFNLRGAAPRPPRR